MQYRKAYGPKSKSSFNLVVVTEVDNKGKVSSTSYEVVDPDGNVIRCFGTLIEAQTFLNEKLPRQPPRPCGPGM
jgi:hypothetical protein